MIIDYEVGETFDNLLVVRHAKRILEKTKGTGAPILLHSDQGIRYSSASYCSLLKSYQVIQSMSRAGTPRYNAVTGSFFGRFKDVLVSHFDYQNCNDIHSVIDKTVYYFNFVKPLIALNKKPPVQFRIELTA